MNRTTNLPRGRTALIIGHPGHELRVHHWLELARPEVFVLTDGSGGAAEGRIASTSRLLAPTGSRPASIYGPYTDKRIYTAIMEGRAAEFVRLTDALVDELERRQIDYVVGDACEGYSPTHDLCRLIVGAAVEIVGRRRGVPLPNYDFFLTGTPQLGVEAVGEEAVCLRLDDGAFERKIEAAWAYSELAGEVRVAQQQVGLDAFRVECLRPVSSRTGYDGPPVLPPYYETYGMEQIRSGRYTQLLRHRDHMAPLAEALWQHAATGELAHV